MFHVLEHLDGKSLEVLELHKGVRKQAIWYCHFKCGTKNDWNNFTKKKYEFYLWKIAEK